MSGRLPKSNYSARSGTSGEGGYVAEAQQPAEPEGPSVDDLIRKMVARDSGDLTQAEMLAEMDRE